MAKQTFTTGQVLTAAQMTSLQQTAMGGGAATPKTTSYTLVAADAGTVIQMNSASATTITVNTALFAAGDSVQIQNIGAGVCTVTAGTATVTTAGSLALSQWEGGQLYFTSASASIFFDVVQTGVSSFNTGYGYVATQESTTSATYVGLTTPLAVTVTTGTKALVIVSGAFQNGSAATAGFMSYAISGATTVAASDNWGIATYLGTATNFQDRKSAARLVTGLTAGSNTFTTQYRTGTGTINYSMRDISVIDMGS
jgi:hypothetical protein